LRQNSLNSVFTHAEALAIFRHGQCVVPSLGTSLIAARILACKVGVRSEGFWRGCRCFIRPARRCQNRSFQHAIVGYRDVGDPGADAAGEHRPSARADRLSGPGGEVERVLILMAISHLTHFGSCRASTNFVMIQHPDRNEAGMAPMMSDILELVLRGAACRDMMS